MFNYSVQTALSTTSRLLKIYELAQNLVYVPQTGIECYEEAVEELHDDTGKRVFPQISRNTQP
jgi:hypothetical protein